VWIEFDSAGLKSHSPSTRFAWHKHPVHHRILSIHEHARPAEESYHAAFIKGIGLLVRIEQHFTVNETIEVVGLHVVPVGFVFGTGDEGYTLGL
jgi:hypothetical protein